MYSLNQCIAQNSCHRMLIHFQHIFWFRELISPLAASDKFHLHPKGEGGLCSAVWGKKNDLGHSVCLRDPMIPGIIWGRDLQGNPRPSFLNCQSLCSQDPHAGSQWLTGSILQKDSKLPRLCSFNLKF